ncbi:MAG: hypothetical protein KKA16_06645 [Alphaproteobacteria bacterium]|nr:hypothetical protein [Alphaproteobacteria bacterium]MBU2379570.1 hypothetical protein [Alphaproteobacteria bacterium]
MTPILFALALTAAVPVQATPPERTLARVIDLALPDDRYDRWMRWGAFGVRLGREVRWHLTDPDSDGTGNVSEGVYRRIGWAPENRLPGLIAVCGNRDEVLAMATSFSQYSFQHQTGDLIAELTTLGVVATEISRTEATGDWLNEERVSDNYRQLVTQAPARQVWAIEKPGHGDATLIAERSCTPPGTRSATQCRTRFTLQFRPGVPDPIDCPLPGRDGF